MAFHTTDNLEETTTEPESVEVKAMPRFPSPLESRARHRVIHALCPANQVIQPDFQGTAEQVTPTSLIRRAVPGPTSQCTTARPIPVV
ncbi:hypothetical protein LshimejAT787_1003680 [Lyophyllum shimeji]|uniref:Uncharacterized protein n=1 Tax=Lyophyllum shimeji TaxID=47721 RepID=A0A9P3UQL0_LYOSH|nr:hypothetical protein LshimejAT787_1003680 [Lyophyllum shimeji]